MSEIAIQNKIVEMFNSESWRNIQLANSASADRTIGDLVGTQGFEVRVEKPLLGQAEKSLSAFAFGGQLPDIALVSRVSGQMRFVIEVKQATESTHKELDASQFVRSLLFLVAATDPRPDGKEDITRGLLIAAPDTWFRYYLLDCLTSL